MTRLKPPSRGARIGPGGGQNGAKNALLRSSLRIRGSTWYFVPEKVGHPWLRCKSASSRQVKTEQPLFPTQIKLLPGKHRRGPARMVEGWHLPPANLFVLPGIEPKQAEQAAFAES